MSAPFRTDLRDRLPLPLARLYRRAHNAKSHLERHHGAFYLLEAAVKLACSAQIAAYLERADREPGLDDRLAALALPALGDWTGLLRDLARRPAGESPLPLPALGRVGAALEQGSGDLPAIADALAEMHARVPGLPDPRRGAVAPADLFESLPRYRDLVLDHASLRDEAFYREMGARLLAAAVELLLRFDPLGGATLIYVAEVREAPGGRRSVEAWDLTGPEALLASEEGWPGELRAGRIYVTDRTRFLDLHPLVVCEPPPPEAGLLFLNRSREGDTAEYLDYVTGATSLVAARWPELRRRIGEGRGEGVPDRPHPPAPDGAPRFGDFDLLAQLGVGAMGTVYLARQRSLHRLVALKMMAPGDDVMHARFQREVRVLARADHPNVVRILQSGHTAGKSWYAMEYVDGSDLKELGNLLPAASSRGALSGQDLQAAVSSASSKRRQQHPEAFPEVEALPRAAAPVAAERKSYFARVAEIGRDAAQGLHHLHERGAVHRDVKPANIMVTSIDGRAVVMDLGLARLEGETSLTPGGETVGTMLYMAPEQLTEAHVAPSADTFALAATLFHLATGRPPRETASEILDEPRPARECDPSVPRQLDAVLAKAMSVAPVGRYPSAAAFGEDLGRFVRGEPVTARPPTLLDVTRLWVRRHRAESIAALGGLLLLLGLTVYYVVGLRSARDEAEGHLIRAEELTGFVLGESYDRFKSMGQLDAIGAAAERVRDFYRGLPARDLTPARRNRLGSALEILGDVRRDRGDREEALRLHREALAIFEDLVWLEPEVPTHQRHTAIQLARIADLLRLRGEKDEAEAMVRRSLEIRQSLAARDPTSRTAQQDLAAGHSKLGTALRSADDLDGAEANHRRALELRRRLVAKDRRSRSDLADTLEDLGILANSGSRHEQAIAFYREALSIREELYGEDPRNATARHTLAATRGNLGIALEDAGRPTEAIEMQRESHRIMEALVAQDTGNHRWLRDLVVSGDRLGLACLRSGLLDESRAAFERCRSLCEDLVAKDPKDLDWQHLLMVAHERLGVQFEREGAPAKALASYGRCREIEEAVLREQPRSGFWWDCLSTTLHAMAGVKRAAGDVEGAVDDSTQALAAIERALAQQPQHPAWRRGLCVVRDRLAMALAESGRHGEAVLHWQQARSVAEGLGPGLSRQVELYARRARRSAALAGTAPPETSRDHLDLALWHQEHGAYVLAARHYAEALKDEAIGGDLDRGHRYNAACAASLASAAATGEEAGRLRVQALAWLEEDTRIRRALLEQVERDLAADPPAERRLELEAMRRDAVDHLAHARTHDGDLAPLRADPAFGRLFGGG